MVEAATEAAWRAARDPATDRAATNRDQSVVRCRSRRRCFKSFDAKTGRFEVVNEILFVVALGKAFVCLLLD